MGRIRAHYFAQIEALLGYGGFVITYCARDTLPQEAVAIQPRRQMLVRYDGYLNNDRRRRCRSLDG
jgi:hypothetical protein